MSVVTGDKAEFKVSLDMHQFNPEDFKVKTVDNYLIIEGNHKEKDEKEGGGFIERHFVRKYLLPEGVDVDHIECNLTPDGTLMVNAPKLPQGAPSREREIPVKHVERPAGEQREGLEEVSKQRDIPVAHRAAPQPPVGQPPREVGGKFEVKLPPGTVEKMVSGQQQVNVPGGLAGKPQHEAKPEHHVTFADVHAPRAEHHIPQPEMHVPRAEHHVAKAEHHVVQPEVSPVERHHVALAEQHLARAEHHVARAEHHVEVAEHVAEAEVHVPRAEHPIQKAEMRAAPEAQRAELHHVARPEHIEVSPGKVEHHELAPEQDFEKTLKEQRSKLHHVPPPRPHVPQTEQPAPFAEIKLQRVQKPEHHMPQPEAEGVHHGVQPEHHLPQPEQVQPRIPAPEHHIPAPEHHIPAPEPHISAPEHHIPRAEEHAILPEMPSHVAAPEHHVPSAELGQQHIPQAEGVPSVLQHIPLMQTVGPSVDQPTLTAQVHAPIAERHVAMAEHHLAVAEHHLAVAEKHVEPILQEQLQEAPGMTQPSGIQGPTPTHVLPIPVAVPVPVPVQQMPSAGHVPTMERQPLMGEQHVPSMESQWPMGEQHVPSMESQQWAKGEETRESMPEHHIPTMESHVPSAEHVSIPEHAPRGEAELREKFSELSIGDKPHHEQKGESVQEILASHGGIGTEEFQPIEQGRNFPTGFGGMEFTRQKDVEMPSAPPQAEEERPSKLIQSTGAGPESSMPLGGSGLSDMPLGETGLGRVPPLEEVRGPMPGVPSGEEISTKESRRPEELSTSRAFGDQPKWSDVGEQGISTSEDISQRDTSLSGGIGQKDVSTGDIGQRDIPTSGGIGRQEIPSIGSETGIEQRPMDVESQGQTKDIHQGLLPSAPVQMEQPMGGVDIRQVRPPMSGLSVSPVKPGAGLTVSPGESGSSAETAAQTGETSSPSAPQPMEPTLIVKMQPSGMSATLLPPAGPKTGTMEVGGVSMDIGTQTAPGSQQQLEQRQSEVGGERSI